MANIDKWFNSWHRDNSQNMKESSMDSTEIDRGDKNLKSIQYRRWMELYGFDSAFDDSISYCKKIYDSISVADVDSCIDFYKDNLDLKNNKDRFCHIAFAKYYLKNVFIPMISKENTMPAKWINELLSDNEGSLRSVADYRLMKDNYWRNPLIDYSQENLDPKNSMVYGKSKMYSISSVEKKYQPASHDAVVQIGLLAGKSIDEVNRLLRWSGHSTLYIGDAVDAIAMFYFQHGFSDEELLRTKESDEYKKAFPDEKYREVYLRPYIIKQHFNEFYAKKLKNSWKNKIDYKTDGLPVFTEKFDINYLIEILSDNPQFVEMAKTNIVTQELNNKLNEAQTLEEFLGNARFTEESELLFNNIYYGLYYKIYKILEKGYDGKVDRKSPEYAKFINNRRREIEARYSIHNIDDFGGLRDRISSADGFGSLTSVSNLLYGREKKEEKKFYDIGIMSKYVLVKYAISASCVDDIPSLLQYAQYWDNDINIMSNGYVKREQDIPKKEEEEYWDCIDHLLYYAYKIQSIQINRDSDCSEDEKNRSVVRKQIHEEFDFIRLILEISRDVQIAYKMEIMPDKDIVSWFNGITMSDEDRKRLSILVNQEAYLVFPYICEGDEVWAEGYRKISKQQ